MSNLEGWPLPKAGLLTSLEKLGCNPRQLEAKLQARGRTEEEMRLSGSLQAARELSTDLVRVCRGDGACKGQEALDYSFPFPEDHGKVLPGESLKVTKYTGALAHGLGQHHPGCPHPLCCSPLQDLGTAGKPSPFFLLGPS